MPYYLSVTLSNINLTDAKEIAALVENYAEKMTLHSRVGISFVTENTDPETLYRSRHFQGKLEKRTDHL